MQDDEQIYRSHGNNPPALKNTLAKSKEIIMPIDTNFDIALNIRTTHCCTQPVTFHVSHKP